MRRDFEDGPGMTGPGGDLPQALRVDARLKLAVERKDGRLRLAGRHEAGAMRFRMPNRAPDAIEAMLVNVAGGLAGGDRVAMDLEARAGAALVLSSAAGERIYRSAGAETRISIELRAGAGASLVWLPHETILQDGARLRRRLTLDLHPRARLLFGEMMQFGRVAAGETFAAGSLVDQWRLHVGGALCFAEATQLEGTLLAGLRRPGGLAQASFMASLLLAGEASGERLAAIRAALAGFPTVLAGASSVSGLVFARLLSEDDVGLRRAFLAAVRAASAETLPLPRVLMASE